MLTAVKDTKAYSVTCQTSKMNLFAKVINDYKGEFKTVKHLRWGFFRKLLTTKEANSESNI